MAGNLRLLKQALLDEYGGFADGRIKNIDRGDRFIIDDRTDRDVGADRALYSYFCSMFLDVIDPHRVEIWLTGNIPMNQEIADWISENADQERARTRIIVTPDNVEGLADLAEAIRRIVRRGATYDVASYKYVCPRTARSLDRVRGVLGRHWR